MEEATTSPNKENESPKTDIIAAQAPNVDDFNLFKPISRGAFGKVYLAYKRSNAKQLLAVKVMKKIEMKNKNMASRVTTERDLMALTDSPYVVKILYSFHTDQNVFLVMEYLLGGDLKSLIALYGYLDEKDAVFYISQVIQALVYLHSLGIVHRDLKPDNMLLTEKGHLKLTDFGLSTITLDKPIDQIVTTPAMATTTRTPGQIISLATSLGMYSHSNLAPMVLNFSSVDDSSADPQAEKITKSTLRQSTAEQTPTLTPKPPDTPFDTRKPSASTMAKLTRNPIRLPSEKAAPNTATTASDPEITAPEAGKTNQTRLKHSTSYPYNSTPIAPQRKHRSLKIRQWPIIGTMDGKAITRRRSLKRKFSDKNPSDEPDSKRPCSVDERSVAESERSAAEDESGELMECGESDVFETSSEAEGRGVEMVLGSREMFVSPIMGGSRRCRRMEECLEMSRSRMRDAVFLEGTKKELEGRRDVLLSDVGWEVSLNDTHESLVEQMRQFQVCEMESIRVMSMMGESENKSPARPRLESYRTPKSVRRGKCRSDVPIIGTADYLAPELIQKEPHSFPVDWWALGVCLFEFMTGVPPFNDDTIELVFSHILKREIPWPPLDEGLSTAARDAIDSLLTLDQSSRPNASDVKKFELFNGVDWDHLLDSPAPFIPNPNGPTDTVYFQARNYFQHIDLSNFEP